MAVDIPLLTLPKFPRLAALLEGKEADFAAQAIKASEELELNEAGDAVKRKHALPDEIDLESRSVFVVRLPCLLFGCFSVFFWSCFNQGIH